MLAASPAGPAHGGKETRQRKAHRKVRTGCTACKRRRQKCGEQRPICAACSRHATDCLYEVSEKAARRNQPVVHNQHPATGVPIQVSLSPNALNLDDLELLHHYMISTSVVTSQLPEATLQAQTAVPQLAQKHHFVMHLILAKAAIHLSWLRSSRKAHYTVLAAKHHGAALPDYRSALQCLNEENHRAVILYAKGLVWSSFAGFETLSNEKKPAHSDAAGEWLPDWFYLLRGSCQIVEACRSWIQAGLFILPPPLDDISDFHTSLESRQILALISRLVPLAGPSVCEAVGLALHEAFARASMRHHNTPLRNAMNYWVGALPDEYLAALQRATPWALVLLAHFCLLVYRSETRWYMKGNAVSLLTSIIERLAEAWHGYLQWPCDEVGLQLESGVS